MGLSRERARTLVTQAAERFDDPFRVIRLGQRIYVPSLPA